MKTLIHIARKSVRLRSHSPPDSPSPFTSVYRPWQKIEWVNFTLSNTHINSEFSLSLCLSLALAGFLRLCSSVSASQFLLALSLAIRGSALLESLAESCCLCVSVLILPRLRSWVHLNFRGDHRGMWLGGVQNAYLFGVRCGREEVLDGVSKMKIRNKDVFWKKNVRV
jgi:hypothetical protein